MAMALECFLELRLCSCTPSHPFLMKRRSKINQPNTDMMDPDIDLSIAPPYKAYSPSFKNNVFTAMEQPVARQRQHSNTAEFDQLIVATGDCLR